MEKDIKNIYFEQHAEEKIEKQLIKNKENSREFSSQRFILKVIDRYIIDYFILLEYKQLSVIFV